MSNRTVKKTYRSKNNLIYKIGKSLLITLLVLLILIGKTQSATLTQKLGNEYIKTTVKENETVKMKFTSKIGYQFKKWIIEEGNLPINTNNNEIEFGMPAGNVTIKAEYAEKYIIELKSNDGQEKTRKIEILAGETIAIPSNTFANQGWEFLGWSTSKDGEEEYQDEEVITPTNNITLYAKWNKPTSTLAPQDTWYTNGTAISKSSIESIELKDQGAPSGYKVRWDASEEKNGGIYAYLEELGSGKYKLTIVGNGSGKIMANTNSSNAFSEFTNAKQITGLDILDTSGATNMMNMFVSCSSLESLDVSGFDTSKVTSMEGMFGYCSDLQSVDVSNFNTINVTNMYCMFYNCSSLTSLNISNFETSNVATMRSMFYGCSSLTSIDTAALETNNVLDMAHMFEFCDNLTSLDVSGFDTRNVTDMSFMFNSCRLLTSIAVNNFDTSKVTDMGWMFSACNSLTSIDVSGFDTSKVTNMGNMFGGCTELTSLDLTSFDTRLIEESGSYVRGDGAIISTGLADFAQGCTNLTTITLNENFGQERNLPDAGSEYGMFYVGTSTSTTVTGTNEVMFAYDWAADHRALIPPTLASGSTWYTQGGTTIAKSKITSIDIKSIYTPGTVEATWDASDGKVGTVRVYVENDGLGNDTYKLTLVGNGSGKIMANADSSHIFSEFTNLKQITGMDMLDTSKVTTMEAMFEGCSNLGTLDISNFNTSKVTNMMSMFNSCTALESLVLGNLDTNNVTTMKRMFYKCSGLSELDVSGLDFEKVTDLSYMFCHCSSLNIIDVRGFDTSKVTDLSCMFWGCSSLTSLDVSGFDTSEVVNTVGMFNLCSGLTSLNISGLDTSKVTDMTQMFANCSSLTSLDVSGLDTSSCTTMAMMFYNCSSLNMLDVSGFNTSQVTDMHTMFGNCYNLENLNVTGFDTSAANLLHFMFYNCSKLTSVNVTRFDTSKVTNMGSMFEGCSSLTSLNVSSFDTSAIDGSGVVMVGENYTTYGLAKFAYGCTLLGSILVGENFGQSSNIPAEGNGEGMFYVGTEKATTVTGANEVMLEYSWATDNRVLLDPTLTAPTLASNSTWYTQGGTTIEKSKITSIDIKSIYTPGTVEATWDASDGKVGTVRVYVEDDGLEGETYKLTIVGNGSGKIMANADSSNAFSEFSNVKQITGLDILDTSGVTNMYCMFYNCSSLGSINVSGFNTSNATNMRSMFNGCSSLGSLNVSGFTTSNVTNMEYMFCACSNLVNLTFDKVKFNTSNVTNMEYMFNGCFCLENLDVSEFITNNVISMYGMFRYCESLTSLDVDNFNTSAVRDMRSMFGGCSSLGSLDVSRFDTSNVTDMSFMFYGCSSLGSLDLTSFDTRLIEESGTYEGADGAIISVGLAHFAQGCTNLTTITLGENFGQEGNIPEAGSEYGMFYVGTEKATTVTGANEVMLEYSWATDNRVLLDPTLIAPTLAASSTWYTQGGTTIAKSSITSITLADVYTPGTVEATWDASDGKVGTVRVYVEDDGLGNGTYKLTLAGNGSGKIYANADSSSAFGDFNNVTKIEGFKDESENVVFDTSNVTNMEYMFYSCKALTELNLSGLNTENVTSMLYMFRGCSALTSLNVSNFDTSVVTNMEYMFAECSSLTSLNVSGFNTDNVTSMRGMFSACNNLAELNVSGFDTSKVTNMRLMFNTCKALTELDVSNFITDNVTTMYGMFNECQLLTELNVSGFNTSKVTDMNSMFNGCMSLTSIDVSNFNTSAVTDMGKMFNRCNSLTSLNVSNFNTNSIELSEVTNSASHNWLGLAGFAYKCPNLTTIILGEDFGQENNIPEEGSDCGMFYVSSSTATTVTGANEVMLEYSWATDNRVLLDPTLAAPTLASNSTWYTQGGTTIAKSKITSIDIKSIYTPGTVEATWDASDGQVGTVTVYVEDDGLGNDTYKLTLVGNGSGKIMANANSSSLFKEFTNVTQITGLDILDTSNVTDMNSMFLRCSSLTTIDVSSFDTSKVTTMSYMLEDCSSLTSIDLSKFNTSNVTTINSMFSICKNLTTLDLSNFNTSKVTTMNSMFSNCNSLTTLNVSSFDTKNVENMAYMFANCDNITNIDISSFETGKVTSMAAMFMSCDKLESITIDNEKFDTSEVTSMREMFSESRKLEVIDVSGFNTEKVTNMSKMFYGCSKLTTLEVGGFKTGNVVNMYLMFGGCEQLEKIDVSKFDTKNVTNMRAMFNGCFAVKELDVSGFNTENVTNMQAMFWGCYAVKELDVSGFNTEKVTTMGRMFEDCYVLTKLDISNFNTNAIEASGTEEMPDYTIHTGLGRFAAECNSLTTIILGEDFGQSKNLPASGSYAGMFYVDIDTNIPTTVVGANSVMTNYVWGSDNRTYLTLDQTSGAVEMIWDITDDLEKTIFVRTIGETIISWGDGTIQTIPNTNEATLALTHEYTAAGNKTVKILNDVVTFLDCNSNKISSLDISRNTALEYLYCYENQLSELNVTANGNLVELRCGSNPLGELNISSNEELMWLSCYSNQLTELNLLNNEKLTYLDCGGNSLTELNTNVNEELTSLACYSNQITTLNLSNNKELTYIECSGNRLTELNTTENTKLTTLNCYSNNLAALNLSTNTALTSLSCGINSLQNLDISQNVALNQLDCHHNQITSLDIRQNPVLTRIECAQSLMTKLYLTSSQQSSFTIVECTGCWTLEENKLHKHANTQIYN